MNSGICCSTAVVAFALGAPAAPLTSDIGPIGDNVPINAYLTPAAIDAGDTTELTIELLEWAGAGSVQLEYQLPAGVKLSDVFDSAPKTLAASLPLMRVPLRSSSSFSSSIAVTIKAEYVGDDDTATLDIN